MITNVIITIISKMYIARLSMNDEVRFTSFKIKTIPKRYKFTVVGKIDKKR